MSDSSMTKRLASVCWYHLLMTSREVLAPAAPALPHQCLDSATTSLPFRHDSSSNAACNRQVLQSLCVFSSRLQWLGGCPELPMVSYYSANAASATRRSRSASVRRSDPENVPVTPISYYERESRRRNRALRDELRSAEASGLLDLAVQRGHSWDTIGIATAIHALAMKVRDQSTSSQEILRDQRWQRLCSLSFARLVEGEARNLANVAWSLANILERDLPFQNHLAELVT